MALKNEDITLRVETSYSMFEMQLYHTECHNDNLLQQPLPDGKTCGKWVVIMAFNMNKWNEPVRAVCY